MSEPQSKDIEDVLASIRRLVSVDEFAMRPGGGGEDRLVLTADQRVGPGIGVADDLPEDDHPAPMAEDVVSSDEEAPAPLQLHAEGSAKLEDRIAMLAAVVGPRAAADRAAAQDAAAEGAKNDREGPDSGDGVAPSAEAAHRDFPSALPEAGPGTETTPAQDIATDDVEATAGSDELPSSPASGTPAAHQVMGNDIPASPEVFGGTAIPPAGHAPEGTAAAPAETTAEPTENPAWCRAAYGDAPGLPGTADERAETPPADDPAVGDDALPGVASDGTGVPSGHDADPVDTGAAESAGMPVAPDEDVDGDAEDRGDRESADAMIAALAERVGAGISMGDAAAEADKPEAGTDATEAAGNDAAEAGRYSAGVADLEAARSRFRGDSGARLVDDPLRVDGDDPGLLDDDLMLDEETLRDLVSEIVREELQGALGERITRNVRKLVRREIARALATRDFD